MTRGQRGQTVNELLMILGLLTAIIIAVSGIVVPVMVEAVGRLITHQAVYLTS